MKLYVQEWEGGKNDFALKENNSNEEPVAGAVAIQICSPLDTCLAYRISMKQR